MEAICAIFMCYACLVGVGEVAAQEKGGVEETNPQFGVLLPAGGPDAFGYTFRDNNPATGGCTYEYIDIAATGTAIGTGDDTVYSNIPIGFDFTYYGTVRTMVNVATNGYLTFNTTGSSFSNSCPQPVSLNDLQISAFWDDLYVFPPSSMLYQTIGTAPNRTFIVQWNNVGFCCTSPPSGAALTFQAQLHETSNIIAFMYSDVQQTTRTAGNSATIGIDGPGSTNFLAYSCNQSSGAVANGRAVFFLPPGVTECAGRLATQAAPVLESPTSARFWLVALGLLVAGRALLRQRGRRQRG